MTQNHELDADGRKRRPLRGAVVGYGFISSQGHVPGYLRSARERGDVEIVAVADICEERRARAHDALPNARLYSDHLSLLRQEASGLDFIDISTPPCDHVRIAHDALDCGLHVFCEKPLATNVADARAVLLHALQARRVIFPCHNYKHAAVVKAVRQVIQSGAIGRVRTVTLNTYRNTHARGVTEWRPDWRRDHKFGGGGIAMDHGAHTFYLAFEWLGGYPTAITAKADTLDSDFDTEDSFTATLTFPTGSAHTFLTWNAGVRKVIYTIHGERGAITVDDDDMQIAIKESNGHRHPTTPTKWRVERKAIASNWMDASHVTWFNSLFDQFKGAIESNEYVGREALEAYLAVMLINAGYESSAQSSREVVLRPDPVLMQLVGVRPARGPQRIAEILDSAAADAE